MREERKIAPMASKGSISNGPPFTPVMIGPMIWEIPKPSRYPVIPAIKPTIKVSKKMIRTMWDFRNPMARNIPISLFLSFTEAIVFVKTIRLPMRRTMIDIPIENFLKWSKASIFVCRVCLIAVTLA